MTVASAVDRNDYTGNGAASSYSYTFKILSSSDLLVLTTATDGTQTTLTLTTDYTVSGAGQASGGTVSLVNGPLASAVGLTIKRDLSIVQDTALSGQRQFFGSSIEAGLDRLAMISQMQQDAINRTPKLPDGEDGANFTMDLPSAANRASSFLVFDASGNVSTTPANTALSGFADGGVIYGASSGFPSQDTSNLNYNSTTKTLLAKNLSISGTKPWADVRGYGALGDGTTDDTAAIQAAITAGTYIYMPPGTYRITSALTITSADKRLVGAGMGITIIKNEGTGNGLECKSLGGSDPTKLRIQVENLTIKGKAGTQHGLYVYDVADSVFRNIETTSNASCGTLIEMAVDCTFSDFYSWGNSSAGVKLSSALKSSVEYTTNACHLRRFVTNSNTGDGLVINRSIGNLIHGGEISANANGITITGAYRNVMEGIWIESNTGVAISTASSTSPTTFYCDYNKFLSNMVAGSNHITIGNGNGLVFSGNYIGGNLTLSGAGNTAGTILDATNTIIGSLTDNGNNTVSMYSPAAMYWKQSSAKRFQIAIGSTVDFTSDILAIRFAMLKGLSNTATQANNLTGYKDIADAVTTTAVSFGTNEADASYGVFFGVWDVTGAPAADSHVAWMTARATTGFTINLKAAPGAGTTVRVSWLLVRV